MTTETVYHLIPEMVLIATAVCIYVAGAFTNRPRVWSWVAGGGVVLAALALGTQPSMDDVGGSVSFNAMACYGRWLALGFGLLLILMSSRAGSSEASEYVGSLLLTIAGLMVTSVANDLVLLFVGLELISIPTYVLLSLGGRSGAVRESAAKYFFLSVLASAIFLYGLCFFYGAIGTTDISAVPESLATAPIDGWSIFGILAMVLILAGLSFKITAVPFHFYAADVYQGTTQINAALMSVIPKAAGFLALVRLLVVAMPAEGHHIWHIVAIVALITMTLGNVLALWQVHLRRLLAYSSIAHAGYMLIALTVALAATGASDPFGGVGAILFYLLVYGLATIGTFAALEYLGGRGRPLVVVEQLNGLARTRPLSAAMMAIFMFSLTGIPVLAGFWGKLVVFWSALSVDLPGMRPWFVTLAILGVLNAAVSAAYYLRVVGAMYFRTPLGTLAAEGGRGPWLAAVVCSVLVIGIGLMPKPFVRGASDAGRWHQGAQDQAAQVIPMDVCEGPIMLSSRPLW